LTWADSILFNGVAIGSTDESGETTATEKLEQYPSVMMELE
tara:strand:+ start:1140 stop:1262 length:123 start_codon:yes stop_codon:yes gene_type:complete